MSCFLCLTIYGFLGLCSLLPPLDAAARFTRFPPSKLYVMKGQTASFVWDYHVDDRDKDLNVLSPRWFFYDSGSSKTIGGDLKYNTWAFIIDTSRCPTRLLKPTIRVRREPTATLVITNVTTADNGEYGCILVLNSGLPSTFPTSKAQLIVTETPVFTERPNPATITTEHSHLTISSTAVGPPTPNITWVRERGVIMTHGVGSARLSFANISRHDSGKYQCQAVNNPNQSPVTASTVVTVYYRPTIDKSLSTSNISSWNGNMVRLRCKYASALPGPTWKWYRPNGDLITSNIHSITDGSEVTVMTGQYSGDYGRYRCKATNVAGSDKHSITVTQLYPPQGPPSMDVVCIQPSSAVIIWTRPVYNGGSPVTGYKVLVNSTTIHINTSNVLHHKEITGLLDDTLYEVKVLARNIAGYGDAFSRVFKTGKQGININSPSTSIDTCYGATVVGVLAFFLSVSLLVIIMFVLYTIWTRKKTISEQGNTLVEMTQPTSYSAPNKTQIGLTRGENKRSLTIPVVPNTPAEYAIPGNLDKKETSQDHYQQLNPATLQYDPAVQYEPLRTQHVTSTDQRYDTYEPLRNRPAEYQSLQMRSDLNNTSFS